MEKKFFSYVSDRLRSRLARSRQKICHLINTIFSGNKFLYMPTVQTNKNALVSERDVKWSDLFLSPLLVCDYVVITTHCMNLGRLVVVKTPQTTSLTTNFNVSLGRGHCGFKNK